MKYILLALILSSCAETQYNCYVQEEKGLCGYGFKDGGWFDKNGSQSEMCCREE